MNLQQRARAGKCSDFVGFIVVEVRKRMIQNCGDLINLCILDWKFWVLQGDIIIAKAKDRIPVNLNLSAA